MLAVPLTTVYLVLQAGTRESPLVFVDDEYIGGYEAVSELNNHGELRAILDY